MVLLGDIVEVRRLATGKIAGVLVKFNLGKHRSDETLVVVLPHKAAIPRDVRPGVRVWVRGTLQSFPLVKDKPLMAVMADHVDLLTVPVSAAFAGEKGETT